MPSHAKHRDRHDPMREIDLMLLEDVMQRKNCDASARKLQVASLMVVVYALVAIGWSSALINGNRATAGTAPHTGQADARFATSPGMPIR